VFSLQGSGSGSGSDSDYKYHNDAEMKNAEHSSDGAEFANNDDTEISEDMNNLTLANKLIIFKQKMFTSFQFLVQKKTELHVWKSAKVPVYVDLNTIKSAEKSTKEFIAQHKHRYKSMCWIVMLINNTITVGAGQYPHISVMVEWIENLEDTLMTQSDLIRVADQAQVDQDLQNHLPYWKMIEFEEQKVFIMSQTEAELLNREMKTMQQIKQNQFNSVKAAQNTFTQSGFAQPVWGQTEVTQSDVAQPVFFQSSVAQPAVSQSAFSQAGVTQSEVGQSEVSQPEFVQSDVAAQAEVTQSEVAQSTQPDMNLFSELVAMIIRTVQKILQQPQPQSVPVVAARK